MGVKRERFGAEMGRFRRDFITSCGIRSGDAGGMDYLDLSLPTAEENIALDEALLDEVETAAEKGSEPRECLRLWEPAAPMVVVGRNSTIDGEVDVAFCRREGIPILRRASGGCAIVTGPGCLMYAVVLSYELRPNLKQLDEAHRFVLDTLLTGLRPLVANVDRKGTCDLVVGQHKFSGNSLRCRRNGLLYHGTLLYDFPLELVARLLKMPPRVPDYRAGRGHDQFVTNLPLSRAVLVNTLVTAFDAVEPRSEWPRELTNRLVNEKYSRREWNYQR